MRILLVGDVMLDRYVYGQVERISPEAPVPVLSLEREEAMLGGAGNVLRNLTSLGAEVTFISVIGTDQAGHQITKLVGKEQCLPYLITEGGRVSTVKTRYVSGQQILRTDVESQAALSDSTRRHLLGEIAANLDCDAFIISDYNKGAVPDGIGEIIHKARVPVIVDSKTKDWSRFAGATVITPNLKEYRESINHEAAEYTLVTQGSEGMMLINGDHADMIPSVAKQVYDVSGAGDTVVAVLAIELAKGTPMLEAAKIANRAAGIVVGKRGTAVITPDELCA